MAMDWTYDLFVEDAQNYSATPIKGVYCRSNASDREKFMTAFKNFARDFVADWKAQHNGKDYDRYDGYVGDAFANELGDWLFSDFYKDTYNQRPHLDKWYYVRVLGLPQSSDVFRTFCSHPVDDAVRYAKRTRQQLEEMCA